MNRSDVEIELCVNVDDEFKMPNADKLLSDIYHTMKEIQCKTGCSLDDIVIWASPEVCHLIHMINTPYVEYNICKMSMSFYGVEIERKPRLPKGVLYVLYKPYLEFSPIYDEYIRHYMSSVFRTWTTQIDNMPPAFNTVVKINREREEKEMLRKLEIKKVIYNDPATIVYWADGSKTVVKAQDGEPFDKEKGLSMAMVKRMYGDKGNYNNIFRKWCK